MSVKERPILFSGEMVMAILDGRKTMTRRVIKPQPEVKYANVWFNRDTRMFDFRRCSPWSSIRCPYGQPGDRLWVRETWQDFCPMWNGSWCGHGTLEGIKQDHRPVYKADPDELWLRGNGDEKKPPCRWRPSIHMPRWASRITLEITDVGVERVQEISKGDAIDEGVLSEGHPEWDGNPDEPQRHFRLLWDSINAKRGFGWDKNPFVWVISFKKVSEGRA